LNNKYKDYCIVNDHENMNYKSINQEIYKILEIIITSVAHSCEKQM